MIYGIVCNKLTNGGGMERYTLDLIKGLLACHSVEIVVFTKKMDNDLLRFPNVIPVVISTWFVPRVLREIYFSWRLKKLRKKFSVDVLISCCRIFGAEIVCCGGTHLGYTNAIGRHSFFDKVCLWLENKQFSDAKVIIAHSKQLEKELTSLYQIPQRKIKVLYPPIDYKFFCTVKGSEKKLEIQNFGKLTFLLVSTSHKRKGFDLLSKFFEATNLPVTLLVAGRPLPKGKKFNNVQYIGYHKDIRKIYNNVDYVILASSYEPFGLAPVEALNCGTPVVISDTLGANEVIKEDVKIVFKSQDILSLEKAIRKAVFVAGKMKERLKIDSGLKKLDFSPEYHAMQIFLVSQNIS